MTTTRLTSLAMLLIGVAASTGAPAQDEGITIEIDKMTCREMLKMGGDERDFTMIFLHGFVSGARGETVFDGPALTAASDAVLDACIDAPEAPLLDTFSKARG